MMSIVKPLKKPMTMRNYSIIWRKRIKNVMMITKGMIQIHMHIVMIGKTNQKTACVVQMMTVH